MTQHERQFAREACDLVVGVVRRCANFDAVKTSQGVLPSLAIGFVVALLGTINLWKVESLRSLVPFDLTLGSAVLAGAVTLFVLLQRRLHLEQSWLPLLIGFALFTPALFVTSLANPYSLSKTRALFTLCFLAAAAPMVLLRSEPRRLGFVRALGALSVVIAVWLLLGGAVLAGSESGRLQIEGANPIAVGRMACLGSVIFALTVLRARGLPRLLCLAGFVLCTAAAVATGSRGPLAAAVVAVAMVLILTGSGRSALAFILIGSRRSRARREGSHIRGVSGRRVAGSDPVRARIGTQADQHGRWWRVGHRAGPVGYRVGKHRVEQLGWRRLGRSGQLPVVGGPYGQSRLGAVPAQRHPRGAG